MESKKLKRWKYSRNYQIVKKTFFKSVCWYDLIHCCIKYDGVFRYMLHWINIKFVKELYKNSICQRTIDIIKSTQEDTSLITKQGAVKDSLISYLIPL